MLSVDTPLVLRVPRHIKGAESVETSGRQSLGRRTQRDVAVAVKDAETRGTVQ
jgi:hypothetical protein